MSNNTTVGPTLYFDKLDLRIESLSISNGSQVYFNITSDLIHPGLDNNAYYDDGYRTAKLIQIPIAPPYIDNITLISPDRLLIDGGSFGTAASNNNSSKNDLVVTVDGHSLQANVEIDHMVLNATSRNVKGVSPLLWKNAGVKSVVVTVSNVTGEPFGVIVQPDVYKVTSAASDLGGLVTISGSRLTFMRWNQTYSNISIRIGNAQCEPRTPTTWSETTLECLMPAWSNKVYINRTNLPVIVTIDGANSNTNVTFSYDVPEILVTKAIQHFNKIGILGQRLGDSAMCNLTRVYLWNQTAIPSSIRFQGTDKLYRSGLDRRVQLVEFDISDQTPVGVEMSLSLQYRGVYATNYMALVIKPIITNISSPPVTGGELSIQGMLFNFNVQEVIISPLCHNVTRVSASLVTCLMGPGAGGNNTLNMTVQGGVTVSAQGTFNYQSPTIHGCKCESIDHQTGVRSVNIEGDNFHSDNITVMIGGQVNCLNITVIDATHLTCMIPLDSIPQPTPRTSQSVIVTVSNQSSNVIDIFKYIDDEDVVINPIIDNDNSTLKWVIPIGVVAVLLITGTFGYLSYKLIHRNKRINAVKKFMQS
ncbi:hypothetical protein SAMD00019534_059540 [Acytostelium subglobosum LB1]|uniref:hypothetical protein n=1 Tax=Acytostelium subglobosum LB1 TaxID=1410327 RepID=UPI0006448A43|nr:hypothetical protein SAMD00019534_059540 [Acytostelium subglobosum LB1]GAM22779.1 hypothetical protein SAMD00019534_059540 [Acytostelium subglobosum LB1]|eukprot:XP_012754006.1 hypothetical protein SAMD00019534_059540 [Acytostelium subglobosum LB1]